MPFGKITQALRRKRAQAEGGVKRARPDLDEELRKKREKERMAAAHKKRLRELNIDPNERVK